MSDETLVEGLRRGSSEAHAQLWQKYGDNLIRFLQSLEADVDDAEDIAVDAVARAVEKIDQFDPQKGKGQSHFRNWLFTIARNLWRDHKRKQKNIVDFDDELQHVQIDETINETALPVTEALNHALSNLPDNQRQTIILYFYDNLPLTQIAQLMGVPEGTVRQWKKRALSSLQSALKDLPIFADLIAHE